MTFWLIALALASAVAIVVIRAMVRARGGEPSPDAVSDVEIYRDQLAEVARDMARGVVAEAEAARLRTEISRRLLEADRKAGIEATRRTAPRALSLVGAALSAVAIIGGAALLYARIGADGYPDLPIADRIAEAERARENRPSQAVAEAETWALQPPPQTEPRHAELMDQLRAALVERPDDLQGHMLLAQNEARLGNFQAARQAQARVLEIKGPEATADDWADYATLLIFAAGGYVSPEAERALAQVLTRDPASGVARFYTGELYRQTGRPDLAFRIWRGLLEESPASAPWSASIRAEIADVARLAGVDYQAPPPLTRGPSAADIAGAADMSDEDRQAMIRGMVEGLAERLSTDGGPAEDWAQLIGALGVLGETDRAGAIYEEARQAFSSDAEDLALIEGAARRAGLAD